MSYEHLTDIEKVDLAYKILNSVDDIVTRLWRIAWGLGHKNCMSAWEYDKTRMMIEDYGYDKVRMAFQESAEQGVFNLKYVKAIIENLGKPKDAINKGNFRPKNFVSKDEYESELSQAFSKSRTTP